MRQKILLLLVLVMCVPVFGAGVTLTEDTSTPVLNVALQFLPDPGHTTGTLASTNDGAGTDEQAYGQTFTTGDAFSLGAVSFLVGKNRTYDASQVLEVAILDGSQNVVAGPFSSLYSAAVSGNWVTLTFDAPIELAAGTAYSYVYTLIGPSIAAFDCYGDRSGGNYADGKMVTPTYLAGDFPNNLPGSTAGRDMYFVLQEYADSGVNSAPAVNAGSDATIYLQSHRDGGNIVIDASAADDGNIEPLSYAWSVVGDATNVSFVDVLVEDPNVTFSAVGSYELELEVNDGEFTVSDIVVITVIDNVAPTADAGADQLITLADGGTAVLAGTAGDDGEPNDGGYLFTTTWSADDALVAFDDASSLITTADFNAAGAGVYVLTLTADDGGGNPAIDTIVITVSKYAMASVTIIPVDDTFVRKNRSDWNQGETNDLRAAATSNNGTCYPYLKFDIYANVPGAIESVALNMKTQEAFIETRVSAVTYGITGEWFEGNGADDGTSGGITWDTDDLVWGGELDFVAPADAETWYEFDVSALQLEDDGKATFGLKADLEGGDSNNDWRSKEYSGGAAAPNLVIMYQTNAAYSLQPVQNATEVHPDVVIKWNSGAGAVTEDVYYDGALVDTITVATDPNEYDATAALGAGSVHTYQIISKNAAGETIGETAVHTFTGMLLSPHVPVNLLPEDGTVDIDRLITFSFTEGEDANSTGDHNMLLGEVSGSLTEVVDGILPGYPNATYEVPGLGTQYFWQIEAAGAGGTFYSEEFSFTTEYCEVIDDFEAGIWAGGVVETVIRNAGAQSMAISYADPVPGTATLTFAGGKDFDALNAGLLHIKFHGAIGNDAELMTVTLSDGVNSATVVYDGDASDIVQETYAQWQNWYIDLGAFSDAGVIMSSVDTLSIGVGDGADAEAGAVYIDDVLVCAPMCIESEIAGDFNGANCMGDPNELMLLARDWLQQEATVTAGGDISSELLVHFTFDAIVDPNALVVGDEYFESTVGGVTGSIEGTVALAAGPVGNAADCAAGLISLDDHATVLAPVTDGLTYAFWAYTEAVIDPATGKFDVSDSRFVTGGGTELYWKFRTDGVYAVNGLGGAFVSNAHGADDSSKIIGIWNHLAYVTNHSGGFSGLYVNGELVEADDNTLPRTVKTASLLNIGNRNTDNMNPVKIDDFRLYSRALSQEEILSIAGIASVVQPVVSAADTNGDDKVNLVDFANIASIWMAEVVWP